MAPADLFRLTSRMMINVISNKTCLNAHLFGYVGCRQLIKNRDVSHDASITIREKQSRQERLAGDPEPLELRRKCQTPVIVYDRYKTERS